jgi:hypothetical protein
MNDKGDESDKREWRAPRLTLLGDADALTQTG